MTRWSHTLLPIKITALSRIAHSTKTHVKIPVCRLHFGLSLLLASALSPCAVAEQSWASETNRPAQLSAQAGGSVFGDGNGVTIGRPLLPASGDGDGSALKTVEVKGLGSSSEEAQRDAARLAVQQVAGLYIDARRRIESKITDKVVSEIIDEKILSYTNAFITKLEVTKLSKQDGLIVVEAKVTVAVAPLVKTLQAGNIPTVAFDTATAIGQVDVSAREKGSAIDLYADLLRRSANLISLGVGTPKVDVHLPAPVDQSWLSIPITYIANEEAIRDWRSKFEQIAAKHMTVQMPVKAAMLGEFAPPGSCSVPVFDVQNRLNNTILNDAFLGRQIPFDQHGVTACFATVPGSGSETVECFGRIFLNGATPSPDICTGEACLSFRERAQKLGVKIELIDAAGTVIYNIPINFVSFPMLNIGGSRTKQPLGSSGFFNYCAPDQNPFFYFNQYMSAYGDLLVIPRPGAHMHAFGNFLLPNDIIARTASLRVRIVQN